MIWSTFGKRWAALPSASAAISALSANLASWATVTRASGFDTFVATPSSANLAALLTDETGAGTAVFSSAIREKLAANRSYYVRPDGIDTNTGLVNSSGGAFLTIQKAIDVVAALDISIYDVDINVADGTYTGGVTVSGAWVGSGTVRLIGNSTTPANCIISRTSANCILVTNYGRLSVLGFKVQAATSGLGVAAQNGGVLTIAGLMDYGACATAHIYVERSGIVTIASNYTVSGNAPFHCLALSDGYIFDVTNTITVAGRAFTAFAKCDRMALIEFSGNTFSGSATGARYSATTGGGINTFGGGASYLPGNAVGTATAPGWYA